MKRNVVYVVAITNLYATITLTIITVNYNSNGNNVFTSVCWPKQQQTTHYTLHITHLLFIGYKEANRRFKERRRMRWLKLAKNCTKMAEMR